MANIPLTDGIGLYTDGRNQPPDDYLTWGLQLADTITKVDADGSPVATGGKLVVAALNGMSNANQEMKAFIALFRQKYGLTKRLTFFNGNRGSWDLSRIISDPNGYWHNSRGGIMPRLAKLKISPMQVQVAWMKNSVRGLNLPEQASADLMQEMWDEAIARTLTYFPNIKLILMSSAMYSGYAAKPIPRKEPQAFYEGIGVRQLVEQHITTHRQGQNTPFVAWGPYMWADGDRPRSDGLRWLRSDFETDGVHPGPGAEKKWAEAMLKYMENNPLTRGWFLPQ
jgi:hypothetical protein